MLLLHHDPFSREYGRGLTSNAKVEFFIFITYLNDSIVAETAAEICS